MSRCPFCDALLTVIGSRARTRRTPEGTRHVLIIRRLRCPHCRRIHHELPDCLVPFKRYDAEALESFATQGPTAAVAADTSTLVHWQAWLAVWMPFRLSLCCDDTIRRCAAMTRTGLREPAPPSPKVNKSHFLLAKYIRNSTLTSIQGRICARTQARVQSQ